MTYIPALCAAFEDPRFAVLRTIRNVILPAGLAVLLAAVSLWMFTRHNDFPLDYHPDEQSKVAQLIDPAQPRNFNHPLLMLEAANAVRAWLGIPNEERTIAIAGRWSAAALAAIAVLAFAVTGYSVGGYPGLLVCGSIVALCPPLDVNAHYFKEDTALLAGLAVAIMGARWLFATDRQWRQWSAAAVMGIGCGAAASGKYVGVVAVAPCLVAAFLAPGFELPLLAGRVVGFVLAAAAAMLAINARAFQMLFPPRLVPAASHAIIAEFFHATGSHEGLALTLPNAFSLQVSISDLMPHVVVCLVVGPVLLARRQMLTRWCATLGLFLLTFAAMLSYSAFPFPRYALPLTVLLYFTAGQLAVGVLQRMSQIRWLKLATFAIFLGGVVALQGARCWHLNQQFADDSRQRLREWVAQNLGGTSTVLAEYYTGLAGTGDPWRYPKQGEIRAQILEVASAADGAATIDRLREKGIDYVAVSALRFERYFRHGIHAVSREGQQELAQHQVFYRELPVHAELVWSSAPSPPNHAYTDPELRVYRLPKPAVTATGEAHYNTSSAVAGDRGAGQGGGVRDASTVTP